MAAQVSISEMKSRVRKLESEKKKIDDLDTDIGKLRTRSGELIAAVEADIRCGSTSRMVDALSIMINKERGVYGDDQLSGAQNRIKSEINNLNNAIKMREDAERQMKAAQQQLTNFKLF